MGMTPEQQPQYGGQYPPSPPQYGGQYPAPPSQPQYGGQYPPPPPPPSQPQYGGYPPPPQPTLQPPNRWGPTSLGMDANVAAGLSYIPIVGLIFFFVEKTNRFVKFHAAQSILLAIIAFIISVIFNVISAAFTVGSNVTSATTGTAVASGLGALFFGCLGFIIGAVLFGLFVWGLINGFTGKYVKFPVIGDIAESWAGGPAVPLY